MRLDGVRTEDAGPFLRLVFRMARRSTARKAGQREVPTPARVMAHNPKVLLGYGALEDMLGRSRRLPPRLAVLARDRISPMVGCHW